ncbi:MAG: hypothetical protein GY765_40395, partial [bacterium]|nr:hypothetical protein [bacterium]
MFMKIVSILTAALLFCAGLGYGAIPPSEREILIAIYNAADGDNWQNNKGWKDGETEVDGFAAAGTEDKWNGVSIEDGHVTALAIRSKELSISPAIAGLPYLAKLNIKTKNQLHVPPELGKLVNLKRMSLDGAFSTLPPELGNLENLESLRISNFSRDFTLPAELGNLTKLRKLDVTGNFIGPIPADFGNLESLEKFTMMSQCTGPLPEELGKLSNLAQLFMHGYWTGNIPDELAKLSNLKVLHLSGHFTGSIPDSLGNLENLTYLSLSGNLTGTIPASLGNLENLTVLEIKDAPQFSNDIKSDNRVDGEIPSSLG